jgi:hypothetical protein
VGEARLEALVLGGEVGALAADRGQRGFFKGDAQPLAAFAGASERRLPADRSLPGQRPAQEARWPAVGKTLMSMPISAISTLAVRAATPVIVLASSTPPARVRAHLVLDRHRQPGDLLIEEVQVGVDRADDQRVVGLEAALERLPTRGDLGTQPAARQIGVNLRVGGARDQRVEHRATGDAEAVGSDAIKLDAGVLQRLVQPIGLELALSDLRLASTKDLDREPPVIVPSALADVRSKTVCLELGACECMSRPFKLVELLPRAPAGARAASARRSGS